MRHQCAHTPHDVPSNSPSVVKLVLRPALISSGFYSHMCVAMGTYQTCLPQTTLISLKLIYGQIGGVEEQDLQSPEPLPFHFNLLLLLTVTCSCVLSFIVSLRLSPLPHFIAYHLLSFFNRKLHPTKLPSKTRLNLLLHIFLFSSSSQLTPFKLYF